MGGSRRGIETDYKRIMRVRREIPESSCPSSISNLIYASGAVSPSVSQDEEDRFAAMLERLDSIGMPLQSLKQEFPESRFHKKLRLGISGGEWHTVDTEGYFWVENNRYKISDNAVQYQPVQTDYGDYYAMDRILSSGGKFYDMNYDEVEVLQAGGIVQDDDLDALWSS